MQDKCDAIKKQYEGEQLGEFLVAYTDNTTEVYVFCEGSVIINDNQRSISSFRRYIKYFYDNMTRDGLELIDINRNPDIANYPQDFKDKFICTYC